MLLNVMGDFKAMEQQWKWNAEKLALILQVRKVKLPFEQHSNARRTCTSLL